MKYIVDTHILLWSILDSGKLSESIIQTYEQADEIQASNINFWEISLKYRLGKLDLGDLTPYDIYIAAIESNYKIICIDAQTTATIYKLPLGKHKDPFDRILIWYAIQNDTALISRDSSFDEYNIEGLRVIK